MASSSPHQINSDLFPAADVLMIRPACFGWNEQTAETNIFVKSNIPSPHKKALAEFDDLVETLKSYGINVVLVDDLSTPYTPDSIFPLWLSFHHQHDGVALLYPMMAENRRLERRRDILQKLSLERGFKISNIYDLSPLEKEGEYLEGLGSIVLDRLNHMAYANLSPRTTLEALGRFSQFLDYKVVILRAYDEFGSPLHHTNILMSICTDFAIICEDAISTNQDRAMIKKHLTDTGHKIILISLDQMRNFAGNVIQLQNNFGEKITFMSERAYSTLHADQIQELAVFGKIVSVAIPTIEDVSGASIGSMINPIYLPKKTSRIARSTTKISSRAKVPNPSP